METPAASPRSQPWTLQGSPKWSPYEAPSGPLSPIIRSERGRMTNPTPDERARMREKLQQTLGEVTSHDVDMALTGTLTPRRLTKLSADEQRKSAARLSKTALQVAMANPNILKVRGSKPKRLTAAEEEEQVNKMHTQAMELKEKKMQNALKKAQPPEKESKQLKPEDIEDQLERLVTIHNTKIREGKRKGEMKYLPVKDDRPPVNDAEIAQQLEGLVDVPLTKMRTGREALRRKNEYKLPDFPKRSEREWKETALRLSQRPPRKGE